MTVDLTSKREQARKRMTHEATVQLAQMNGHVSALDYLQIHEAVASTLEEKMFSDE